MRCHLKSEKVNTFVHKSIEALCALIIALSITGQVYASDAVGTVSVQYAPISASGVLTGCSLIYTSFNRDNVYSQGNSVALNGNISLNAFPEQKAIILTYKLGIRDVTNKGLGEPYPPYFMFLKTSEHTTAKSKFVPNDSDVSGYRIYALQLDKDVLGVLGDMLAEVKVIIGYNHYKGAMDAFAEIDLTVKDSNFINGEMKKDHSVDAINQYANAFMILQNSFNDKF